MLRRIELKSSGQGWSSLSDAVAMMPRQRRHIIAGVVWVLASFVAWELGVLVFVIGMNRLMVRGRLSDSVIGWIGNTYTYVAIAGALLIPAAVAVLAMRAKLPWTGPRASNYRGFAVESPPPRSRV